MSGDASPVQPGRDAHPDILGQAARVDVPGRPVHLAPLTNAAPLPGGLVCTLLGGTLGYG